MNFYRKNLFSNSDFLIIYLYNKTVLNKAIIKISKLIVKYTFKDEYTHVMININS